MRFGRAPSGDFLLLADLPGAEIITQLSPNAADALFDALVLFRAERAGMVIPDEPTTIVGDS